MLKTLTRALFLILFLIRLLQLFFPKQMKTYLLKLFSHIIYGYSIVEIKYKQTLNYVKSNEYANKYVTIILKFLEKHNFYNKTEFEFILNGETNYTVDKKTFLETINSDKLDKTDFIIYSDYNNNCANKQIIQIKDLSQLDTDFKYALSNIKFILMELNLPNDINIKIDLKTNQYNYYVVGNIINLAFLKYFLNKHHKLNDINLNDATICIIDDNINRIEYKCEKETLQIELNNYIKS